MCAHATCTVRQRAIVFTQSDGIHCQFVERQTLSRIAVFSVLSHSAITSATAQWQIEWVNGKNGTIYSLYTIF